MPSIYSLSSLALLGSAAAHVALWDPAMYGWDASDPNQSDAVTPLYNMTFDQWWFHGYINQPPAANTFMELPAGGVYHGEVSCNKALTSYGDNAAQETGAFACDTIGPLHTTDAYGSADPADVKGCGLSIAYQSDASQLKPSDFAVISTNWSCPWRKDVDFQIPADLPPCPAGGCHCMWGWVHAADSGSEQMYTLGYRCNVTGATGTQAIPQAKTANKCDLPTDTSNCTVGPRQMHYWLQQEQNNNFQGYYDPPFYNGAYGFMNGAQTDLFAGVSSSTDSIAVGVNASASVTASTSSASASASSSAQSLTLYNQPASTSASTSSVRASSLSTASSAASTSAAPSATSSSSATYSGTYGGTVGTTTFPSVTIANAAVSTVSVSASPASSSLASSSTSCKRRKRALDRLDTAEQQRRHAKRAARRAARLAERSRA